jgi:hypothetical protein
MGHITWWIFTKAKEASSDEVAYCQVVAILLSKLKKWQIHFNYITSIVLPLLMLLNSSATLRLHFVPSRPSRSGRHAGATTFGGTNDSGETPPVDTALQGLYKKFPGLKRDLIKSIRQAKFIPRMLFKLRYAQGVNADRRTLEVLIQDGKIEVATKDYLKDYGRTPSIWTEGFINYTLLQSHRLAALQPQRSVLNGSIALLVAPRPLKQSPSPATSWRPSLIG